MRLYELIQAINLNEADQGEATYDINQVIKDPDWVKDGIHNYSWNERKIPPTGWFHGSDSEFDLYDPPERVNSQYTPRGMYFTRSPWEANQYGKNVYEYEVFVKNAFVPGQSRINNDMVGRYLMALYDCDDVDADDMDKLISDFKRTGGMHETISDKDKTEIIMTGGYDCANVSGYLVVFNPSKNVHRIGSDLIG